MKNISFILVFMGILLLASCANDPENYDLKSPCIPKKSTLKKR
ncbi:hypothetical protein Cyrtocomes_00959 [Candidatus Cyrtobacter comes]|uniref:Lipoprotein n=1 Tax=Candidatus Cyrtobacter comes TaxID=675776 RepID=A0ABU5L8X8_9RICK|nr:hypothetical protein [Candidatus Cyrtobacter comes]